MSKAEAVPAELLEAAEEMAAEITSGPIQPPFVSWTIKMVSPGGSIDNPDFIRVEGNDPYVIYQQVSMIREMLAADGWQEANRGGGTPSPAPSANAPARAAQKTAQPGAAEVENVFKYTLERRTDGKYTLSLWGILANGNEMEWPFTRFTAEYADMQAMLIPAGLETVLDDPLPVENRGNWIAEWVEGRPTPKGGRYKDLVSFRKP